MVHLTASYKTAMYVMWTNTLCTFVSLVVRPNALNVIRHLIKFPAQEKQKQQTVCAGLNPV